MTVSIGNGVSTGNIVTAETTLTGGIEFSDDGKAAMNTALDKNGVARYGILANGISRKMRQLQGAGADERHLSAVEEALRPLIRSTAWRKIRELWVPTGTNLAAALVKIKSAYNAVNNESLIGVNFTDADYVPTVGLIGDGSSKYLYSQSTPTDAKRSPADAVGCVVESYGFAAYPTSSVYSTSGTLLGARSGSNYRSLGVAGASGGGDAFGVTGLNRSINTGVAVGHRVRMQFIQSRDGEMLSGTGALIEARMPASETAVGTSKIFIYAQNSGSNTPQAGSYYNGPISGYALFDSLTDAELHTLSNFFDDVNLAFGRIGNDIVFFGDSNAASTGVTITQRWAYRVAVEMGGARILPSATRARASNIATVTFTAPHNLRTGDAVQTMSFGGSDYNSDNPAYTAPTLSVVQVTVVDSTTISYPCVGSDEASVADTGGLVVTGYSNVASNGSTVSYCPTVGSNGVTNGFYQWTWPVNTTGASPAAKWAYLFRAFQFSGALYVFNIGANDCAFKGDISDFEAAYRATMVQLVSAGIPMRRLLLTSLLFGNYQYAPPAISNRTETLAIAYNAVIAKIAADFGCKYIDLYTLWDASNYQTYMLDESSGNGGYPNWIHANADGCKLIYARVMQAIAEI